jgi:UDP-N-acetylmuramoyl-tripeptide--D-alanyl-D-alanine ligase
VAVDNVSLDESLHPTFDLHFGEEAERVSVPVAGAHMALNAAAAVAAAVATGVPFADAAKQVGAVDMSPWRMEVTKSAGGAIVINDAYNANPTSMRAALATLVETGAERLVAVVGEMAELGEEGPAEHLAVTAEATEANVRVIAVAAGAYGPDAEHVGDVDEALVALGDIDAGTAVLVKGSRVTALERLAERLAVEHRDL